VDGFCYEALRAALTAEFPAEWFTFVHNERYATTNNAYSLLLARYPESEPFLLVDSDVMFDPGVVQRMLAAEQPNRLALRTQGTLGEEEIKVVLAPDGRVTEIGKEIDPGAAAGESVGLEVFSAPFAAKLFATLERRVIDQGQVNEWYESSFVELLEAGEAIHAVDLGPLRSLEVDTLEDLERARELFG
jgi:choline kinase